MRFLLFFVFAMSIATCYGAEENYFLYFEKEQLEENGLVDRDLYREAVKQLPICCVDVFLYNPIQRTYLMMLRGTPPKKGDWWYPGGRLFKGESFFECAIRKCKEEAGAEIVPLAQLGTATTVFPDSAWGCQTHTVNTVVLAKLKNPEANLATDSYHEGWAWKPLDSAPEGDTYLQNAYNEALKIISHLE